MLGAVAPVNVLDDLLAPGRREVDVDVGIARSALVDKTLEEQVVPDRIDPSYAEHVGHDRIGRTTAALGGNAALAGEAHQVPADQEELGQAGLFDDLEFVGELLDHRRRNRVIPAAGALLAQLVEVRKRRVALRDGKTGEAIALETEVDRTRGSQLAGIPDSFSPSGRRSGVRVLSGRARRRKSQNLAGRPRPVSPDASAARQRVASARAACAAARQRVACRPWRHPRQFHTRLQIRLPVRTAQIPQLSERPAVADRGQDVLHLTPLGIGVVDVVRDHDRQPQLAGEAGGLGHEPIVIGEQVVLQLEEER